MRRWIMAALLCGGVAVGAARGEEIAIAQYGSSTSGMPWAVALAKGFFKDAGVDITAIRASAGGSADLRNMIAGDLPYAESALAAVLTASKSGADIKIVSENVHTVANFVWVVAPNSPIASLADLKGKRLTFTTPQSTSEVVERMIVAKQGLHNDDVRYLATGPYGAALTALSTGGADVALVAEPVFSLNKDRVRALAWVRDHLPPIVSTIGVVPTKVAKERPEIVRGILLAHRRAVEFMRSNRTESAAIIAKVYKLDPALVESVLAELIDHPSEGGVPYYSLGDFNPAGIDRGIDGLKLMNALDNEAPWRSLVDQSFLPADLQRKL